MERVDAQRICELIAGLMLTDGELHATENRLLVKLLKDFGLGEVAETILAPTVRGDEAALAIRQLPPELQKETLELLIDAAVVDGKVVPTEQRYLDAVAKAMGVSPAVLEEKITDRLAGD